MDHQVVLVVVQVLTVVVLGLVEAAQDQRTQGLIHSQLLQVLQSMVGDLMVVMHHLIQELVEVVVQVKMVQVHQQKVDMEHKYQLLSWIPHLVLVTQHLELLLLVENGLQVVEMVGEMFLPYHKLDHLVAVDTLHPIPLLPEEYQDL
tara:strand:- start:88 stop:528 length:441 start_codon:yes stop_codon:yes gene_type:complete